MHQYEFIFVLQALAKLNAETNGELLKAKERVAELEFQVAILDPLSILSPVKKRN